MSQNSIAYRNMPQQLKVALREAINEAFPFGKSGMGKRTISIEFEGETFIVEVTLKISNLEYGQAVYAALSAERIDFAGANVSLAWDGGSTTLPLTEASSAGGDSWEDWLQSEHSTQMFKHLCAVTTSAQGIDAWQEITAELL
jgi:hypothetical protein